MVSISLSISSSVFPIRCRLIAGQGYLKRDLDVAARDGTIVLLALMGGRVIEHFDAGAILLKRLTVRLLITPLTTDPRFNTSLTDS